MFKIARYISPEGKDLVEDWLDGLRDRKALIAIDRRLNRLASGNFGDHKSVGGGVSELRIDVGAGYRAYFARSGDALIVLLCGGDKSTQRADIAKAHELWSSWKSRQKG